MTILLLLIPLSLMLVGIAAWAFAWAVRRGQFDNLDTPALDILGDDHPGTDAAGEDDSGDPRSSDGDCDSDSDGDSEVGCDAD